MHNEPTLPVFSCLSFVYPALACILLMGSNTAYSAGATGLLNDTGQIQCDNGTNVMDVCNTASTGDTATMPRQDGRFGRDAGSPAKVGSGAAGFDFTKIANDGSQLDSGALLGSAETEWGCTRDNITGLMWEVKTAIGLRSVNSSYSWYFGVSSGGTANGGSCSDGSGCDTEKFIADVNAARLCNHSDWRLPTRNELLSIVHNGQLTPPMIDTTFFTAAHPADDYYWTMDDYTPTPGYAWRVYFTDGSTVVGNKDYSHYVRLVRSGP